jgi:hypothetical protein
VVEDLAREGALVRWIRSVHVAEDDACLVVFEAASPEAGQGQPARGPRLPANRRRRSCAMKASLKTLAGLAILVCAVGSAVAVAGTGGDRDDRRAAAARAAVVAPLEVALEPAHRSGVSGTARLVSDGAQLEVTLTLSDGASGIRTAHIHSASCGDEPTVKDPRIWANLTEVTDGRSQTTLDVVTLRGLRSEAASINVYDPDHGQRALVCGDIPRDSEEHSDAR